VDGAEIGDQIGYAFANAGDVDHDGISDLILGAPRADLGGEDRGAAFVVFGNHAPLREGPEIVRLPPLLEDTVNPPGSSVRGVVSGPYLDADPPLGVAIDRSPASTGGHWQYGFTATPATPVPDGLSPAAALVVGAASSGANAGSLRFVPAADFFGDSDALLLRMWDGTGRAPDSPPNIGFGEGQQIAHYIGSLGGFSNDANRVHVVQPVLPVNDAPAFSAADPAPVGNDAGVVQIPGWATFSPGPANESDQIAVQFPVSDISHPELFASGFAPRVIVDGDGGMLQFAPVDASTFGSSTFTVRVRDSGGTANGGVDTSPPQTFTITLVPTAPLVFADDFE
jgi:hypothetical protein